MANPNRRLRKSAAQQIRRTRMGMEGTQGLFSDPNTDTFAKISARMEATRRHTAALGGAAGDGVMMATGRPKDPMFYWRQNNVPFDFTKPEEQKKIREFCNTPDAPILLVDGTYKNLGDMQPGDQVLGWKSEITTSGAARRHWQASTVLAVNSRIASTVEVTLASGKTIRCTPDHKWANPYFSTNIDYSAQSSSRVMEDLTQEYRPAAVGNELLAVNGTFTVSPDQAGPTGQGADPMSSTSVPSNLDRVVSITDLGEQTVVSMQTTTGNYVAWNFASKNCRLLYMTHPVVAACVDIYSKLPLQGMHVECLAGETKVWTDQGLIDIAALAGSNHKVVTTGGKWVDAKFESYGERELYAVNLKRNRRTKIIYATEGHRWFTVKKNGSSDLRVEKTTVDLAQGDRLTTTFARNVALNNITPSSVGIAHGAVYGDGSMNYGQARSGSYIDLHGHKDLALLPHFGGAPSTQLPAREGRNVTALRVTNLPRSFKSLPSLDESYGYLYGWLAGYFAADGTVSKNGESYLDSVDLESIEFANLVCQILGIRTYEPYTYTVSEKKTPQGTVIKDWVGHRLPIDSASLSEAFFVIDEHRGRWATSSREKRRAENWVVESVEKTDRVETVYCAVVPETESFVLEGNILTGNCKDDQLVEFYTDLFFDQLDLEDHLVRMGRQYWLSGEIFSLGMWNENLGVWEDEQIISPDDVEVESSLFIKKPRFMMRLPEEVRRVLTERAPVHEYQELISEYPELMQFAKEDQLMPVSNYIMFQMKFEADAFSNRGISILMRAFRTLIQEEMLMSALDSIADRLYTPMIVAKLGASASDLGTDVPWVPTDEQKLEFNQSLDAALAADFRVLTTNFATNIETVFGRENVPDLSNDFDRITERILMAFGLSQTMLTGASAGETYAADALNRDVVTQLLTHYQRKLQDYFKQRAAIVAEAQEHFDYEVRNGERFLVTEDIYEIDEETGEEVLLEQPKLLIPDLKFKILNLTDESEMSEFIESLAMDGQIPIPIRERIKRTGLDFDEMIEIKTQETIQLAVAEQRTRKELYSTLLAEGLPIPDDLIKDFRPQAIAGPGVGASDVAVPSLGQGPQDLPVLAPTEDDLEDDQMAEGEQMDDDQANEQTDPSQQLPQEGDDVPPESTEQMGRMPKASLKVWPEVGADKPTFDTWRKMSVTERKQLLKRLGEEIEPPKIKTKAVRKLGIREVTKRRYQAPDNSQERELAHYQPEGKFGMPKHVGMRRYLPIPDSLKLRSVEEE